MAKKSPQGNSTFQIKGNPIEGTQKYPYCMKGEKRLYDFKEASV
jgi:hypothetical protein